MTGVDQDALVGGEIPQPCSQLGSVVARPLAEGGIADAELVEVGVLDGQGQSVTGQGV